MAGELGIVVRVSPAYVDPGQEPGAHDDRRAEHDPQRQTGRQLAAQGRLVEGDQQDEAEVEQQHRQGEQQGETALTAGEGAEVGRVAHPERIVARSHPFKYEPGTRLPSAPGDVTLSASSTRLEVSMSRAFFAAPGLLLALAGSLPAQTQPT